MYNTELKERFIKEQTSLKSVRAVYVSTFKTTEQFEEAWGADICTRPAEDIQQVLNQLAGLRKYSTLRIDALIRYIKWCCSNGVAGAQEGYVGLTASNIEKVKERTVTGPRQLQLVLDAVFSPETDLGSDNIYRTYLWLGFSGLTEEEALTLRCDELDFARMVINHNGRVYPIYREAVPALKVCAESTHFIVPRSHQRVLSKTQRVSGNLLLRGVKTQPSARTIRYTVRVCVSNAFDQGLISRRISYTRAWYSGVFYRMYESECAGVDIGIDDVVDEMVEGKEYSGSLTSRKTRIKNALFEDYLNWKHTF
jgi:hypothetical protein